MKSRMIYVTCDDFGWTDGHNLAVERAHTHGVLNRASLMATGDAFDEAVALAKRLPRLGVGVHLVLNETRPLLDPVHLLGITRSDGAFHDSFMPVVRLWLAGRLDQEAVLAEWHAQVRRVKDAGISITHLDGHKHVHLLPPLLEATIRLAREFGVSYVRLPLEALSLNALRRGPAWLVLWVLGRRARRRLLEAGLSCTNHFVGFGTSGRITADHLRRAINEAPTGITEIMTHPAVITPAVEVLQRRFDWAARYQFEGELAALCDPVIVRVFKEQVAA